MIYNFIKLSWWCRNFRELLKPFQHSNFIFIARITSIFPVTGATLACQTTETSSQHRQLCPLQSYTASQKQKEEVSKLYLPAKENMLEWLHMYGNRSLTSILKIILRRNNPFILKSFFSATTFMCWAASEHKEHNLQLDTRLPLCNQNLILAS